MYMTHCPTVLVITTACVVAPLTAQGSIFGHWQVTGSLCPAECRMSQKERESWRGRGATYGDTLARFADHACQHPRYVVGYWPASGVYGGAHLKDLGIAADSAMVVDVQCPGEPQARLDPRWRVPGAFLIVRDHDHLLAVWEGAFFELTRQKRAA
jgi:hypothetical protein